MPVYSSFRWLHAFLAVAALFWILPARADAAGIVQVEHFPASGRPALIFIPALACGPWEWRRQIAALRGRYDIYVLRLPGFDGLAPVNGDALVERALAGIAELVRANKLAHPLVIGHSIGGSLAIDFAERYPGLAGGIIAIEGGYPASHDEAERRKVAAEDAKPFRGLDRAQFKRTFESDMLKDMLQRRNDVQTVGRLAARSDPDAVAAWLYDVDMLDLTPGLSKIRVPVVEIVPFDASVDARDGLTLAKKRALYQRWLKRAPRGSVVMIDHARHFVMFDRPAAFDDVLFGAIRRMSA
ncbi:MAG: alpha/beta fold hydrolase [Vulcanimicrobiaceae bacterium]